MQDIDSVISKAVNGDLPSIRLGSQAPLYSYRHVDNVTLSTLSELLPSPIVLTLKRTDVLDGPEVTVQLGLGLDFDGLRDLSQITVRLGRTGVTLEDGSQASDILAVVQKKILKEVAGHQIQFNSFGLSLSEGKILSACPGASGYEFPASATILGHARAADIVVTSCGPKLSVALQKLDSTFSETLASTLREKLPKNLQVSQGDFVAYVANDELKLRAPVKFRGCVLVLDLNLTKDIAEQMKSDDIKKNIDKILECALAEALTDLKFSFDGIPFKATGKDGVFCSEEISSIGRFCVTGVKPPFQKITAELQNSGDAVKNLTGALQNMVKNTVVIKQLKVEDSHIVAVADATLPGLGQLSDLKITITNKGISADAGPVLRTAVGAKLAELTKDGALSIAGAKITNIKLKSDAPLSIEGTISYGGFLAPVTVDILPKLNVQVRKPSIAEAFAALKPLLGMVSNVSDIQLIDEPDGLPTLKVEVQVGIPLIGSAFTAGAVVEARNGTNLRFAGPVSITLPTPWIPLTYVAIGRIRSRIDLNEFKDVTIGASLTIAPGEGTYEIVGVDGDLHVGPNSVDLNSILKVISIPLGQSNGSWRFKEGMLEVTVGSSNLPDIIPLPSGRIVIDGQACAFAGSASTKFLGAELASVRAGVLVAGFCQVGPPRDPLVVEIIKRCGDRGPLARLCLFGEIAFGSISGSGLFSTRLDQIVPTVSGEFNLAGLARFDVGLNAARARLATKVLGFRLAIVLPSVTGLNEDFLRNLIANLLKPSIDLQALLHGDIQISPASKAGRGDDAMVDAESSPAKEENPKPPQTGPPSPPAKAEQKQVADTKKPTTQGDYEARPGTTVLGIRQYKSSPYWQVTQKIPGAETPTFPYFYFNHTDAEELRKGKSYILDYEPLVLADGAQSFLACRPWPCQLNGVVAIRAYKAPDDQPSLPISSQLDLSNATKSFAKDSQFLSTNPTPDGLFGFPGLIDFLAARVIANETGSLSISCIPSTQENCGAGLLKTGSARSLIFRGEPGVLSLPADSFGRQLLETACPSDCDSKKTPEIIKLSETQLIAVKTIGSSSIILYRSFIFDQKSLFHEKTTLGLLNLNDMSFAKMWDVVGRMNGFSFNLWRSKIDHFLLEDVLNDIATKVKPGSTVQISTSSDNFVSAIANDNTSELIWSAVRQDGKSCIRSRQLSAILAKIQEWAKANKLNPSFANTITGADRRPDLLNILSDPEPHINDHEFILSPLLLFDDPAKSCA